MANLTIGMSGSAMDLESLRRLVSLADYLDFPDAATIGSNVQHIGVSVGEAEIKWDKVASP
jgi:hypothetical protein